MDFLRDQAIKLVLPLVLGPVVYFSTQGLKRASTFIDGQKPIVKQGVAIAVSALVVALGHLVPGSEIKCAIDGACALSDITPDVIKALFGAGVAFLLHFKAKQVPV